MNKRRKFTTAFKSQVVLQLLSGEKSMAELCRQHQLTSQGVGNWKQQSLADDIHAASYCPVLHQFPGAAGSRAGSNSEVRARFAQQSVRHTA